MTRNTLTSTCIANLTLFIPCGLAVGAVGVANARPGHVSAQDGEQRRDPDKISSRELTSGPAARLHNITAELQSSLRSVFGHISSYTSLAATDEPPCSARTHPMVLRRLERITGTGTSVFLREVSTYSSVCKGVNRTRETGQRSNEVTANLHLLGRRTAVYYRA